MKTRIVMLGLTLMAMIMVGLVQACGNKEESAKVAEKIEKGESLSQGDYTVMIKYLGDFAEKVQPIQNQINDMSADNPEAAALTSKIDSLRSSLSYLSLFTDYVVKSSQKAIGEDNVAMVNKYAPLEWFTAPDWATVTADPGVAGMVLQTPDSTGDTAVVAGAVDELTVRDL